MKISKISYAIILMIAVLFAIFCWFTPLRSVLCLPTSVSLFEDEIEDYQQINSNILLSSKYNKQNGTIDYYICNAIKIKSVNANIVPPKKVLLGGDTWGIEYNTQGVLVLGKNKLYNNHEFFDNLLNNELTSGDLITEVNGVEVNSGYEIASLLNSDDKGEEVLIKAIRKGKEYSTRIKPAYDVLTKKYKLGLWVKNKVNGIGTLTYINPETNRFGSLGHAIVENNSNLAVPVLNGEVYDCSVLSVRRASKGTAGELRGVLKQNRVLGTVDKNVSEGVYGYVDSEEEIKNRKEILVGGKHSVVPGKALIYCSIDGKNIRAYDIEIVKVVYNNKESRDMIIKVTDPTLIKATGGIVQGMSGSPIVQNGKLVGAVTHVFLNDATKGFGIFIDNMLKN